MSRRCSRIVMLLIFTWASSMGCNRKPPEPEAQAPPDKPVLFLLQLEPATLQLEQGASARIKVTVARKEHDGPINLEAKNLPAGVTASPVSLAAGQTVAELELKAGLNLATAERADVTVVGSVGQEKVTANAITVKLKEARFTLKTEPGQVTLSQGGRGTIKVVAVRQGYLGPIAVELRNLPAQVQAAKKTLPAGKDAIDLEITAEAKASEGDKKDVQAVGSATTLDKQQVFSPRFTLSILGAPFTLQAEPQAVTLRHGSKSRVKVNVVRRDYQGPVALEVRNLPPLVTATKTVLPEGQASVEIELTAQANADSGKSGNVQVVGVATTAVNRQAASGPFSVVVEGRPFDIKIAPATVELTQGGAAKLKITTNRKGYDGLIKMELRNLPKDLSAGSATIARGQNSGEIEIVAGAKAVVGDTSGLHVVGTTVAETERQVSSPTFTVRILGPFALQVQPAVVSLVQGGKNSLKVHAVRRIYQGAIVLDLRNLPAAVTASQITLPAGQNDIEIELAAGASAPPTKKNDVQVLGTAVNTKEQVASGNFTIALARKLFDLKVQPALVNLSFGGKATLRIAAARNQYEGPIALEVRNLPPHVSVPKMILSTGQNDTEIELTVEKGATAGRKTDVQVVGIASAGGNQQNASAAFTVSVQPGLFDLRVEPVRVKLTHGGNAMVKVTAQRRGYDGPIAVDLRKLPTGVTAAKTTIAAGQSSADIEVKANFEAALGDKVDAYAFATTSGNRQVSSTFFTVAVGSSGSTPALELRVEPAAVKLPVGGTAKVKVTAVRKSYDGPITVELKNLPLEVDATRATIAKGENSAEITITARPSAESGSVAVDACALGIATAADNHPYGSSHFMVSVTGKK